MSALIGVLIATITQQGGSSMTSQIKRTKQARKIREALRKALILPVQEMTKEEWERLEGKKRIASSEQVRKHMRAH